MSASPYSSDLHISIIENRRRYPRLRLIRDLSQIPPEAVFFLGILAGAIKLSVLYVLNTYEVTRLWSDSPLVLSIQASWQLTAFYQVLFLDLFVAGVTSFVYSALFKSGHRTGLRVGLSIGFLHFLLSGVFASFSPLGLFASNEGAAAMAAFFFTHMIFGGSLGLLFDFASLRDQSPRSLATVT